MRTLLFPIARWFSHARAAPTGGARHWRGWGCAFLFLATSASGADKLDVPSGQDIRLSEVLIDENPGALWLRFRFLAPQISRDTGSIVYNQAAIDMAHLCDVVAAPFAIDEGIEPERIVISLADRWVEFGVQDPDATQFFETYRLESARCIWEEF